MERGDFHCKARLRQLHAPVNRRSAPTIGLEFLAGRAKPCFTDGPGSDAELVQHLSCGAVRFLQEPDQEVLRADVGKAESRSTGVRQFEGM